MSKRLLVLAVPVLAITLLGAACSSDDGGDVTGSGSASGSGSTASADCDVSHGTTAKRTDEVHAELTEWSITLDKKTVKAGTIEFDVKNTGRETHEFVIVQGAKPGELTITDDGVDEDALPAGAKVLGEVEGVKKTQSCPATFKLAAGDYTLLCNIVDKDMGHVHAKLGMITPFTVS